MRTELFESVDGIAKKAKETVDAQVQRRSVAAEGSSTRTNSNRDNDSQRDVESRRDTAPRRTVAASPAAGGPASPQSASALGTPNRQRSQGMKLGATRTSTKSTPTSRFTGVRYVKSKPSQPPPSPSPTPQQQKEEGNDVGSDVAEVSGGDSRPQTSDVLATTTDEQLEDHQRQRDDAEMHSEIIDAEALHERPPLVSTTTTAAADETDDPIRESEARRIVTSSLPETTQRQDNDDEVHIDHTSMSSALLGAVSPLATDEKHVNREQRAASDEVSRDAMKGRDAIRDAEADEQPMSQYEATTGIDDRSADDNASVSPSGGDDTSDTAIGATRPDDDSMTQREEKESRDVPRAGDAIDVEDDDGKEAVAETVIEDEKERFADTGGEVSGTQLGDDDTENIADGNDDDGGEDDDDEDWESEYDSEEEDRLERLEVVCKKLMRQLRESRSETKELENMLADSESKFELQGAELATLRADLSGAMRSLEEAEVGARTGMEAKNAALVEMSEALEVTKAELQQERGRLEELERRSADLERRSAGEEARRIGEVQRAESELSRRIEQEAKARAEERSEAATREGELMSQLQAAASAAAGMRRALEAAERSRDEATSERDDMEAALRDARASSPVEQSGMSPNDDDMEDDDVGVIDRDEGQHNSSTTRMSSLRSEALELREALAKAQVDIAARDVRIEELARADSELRVALKSVKEERDARASARVTELEVKLSEMSELVYDKQRAIEQASTEKSTRVAQLEREIASLREEVNKARSFGVTPGLSMTHGGAQTTMFDTQTNSGPGSSNGTAMADIESGDGVPMSALGRTYKRLANHRKVGRFVRHSGRIIDEVGFGVARLLRQHPPARVFFFMYVLFMHVYIWFVMFHFHEHLHDTQHHEYEHRSLHGLNTHPASPATSTTPKAHAG